MGLTEPGAGSDVVGARSTARREGDEYVLNGEKMWISLAGFADNFLFFCWTDEEKRRQRDHSGMSCFIVERTMKGFTSGTNSRQARNSRGQHRIFFFARRARAEENLVGEEGEGFKIAMFALEAGKVHCRGRRDRSHPRVTRRLRSLTRTSAKLLDQDR